MKNTDRKGNTDEHGQTQTEGSQSDSARVSPCESVPVRVPPVSPKALPSVLAANGALSLLNLCIYLLDRQMQAQAKAFEEQGGFTERLYHRHTEQRRKGAH